MNQQELLKQMTDEAIADFGPQAEEIGRKKGIAEMTKFIHEKIDSKYAARWAARWGSESTSTPVSEEVLALRDAIAEDIGFRLRMGNTNFDNPSFSIEDQAKAQWLKDASLRSEFFENYPSFLAYKRAEGAGLIRLAANKVVR